MLDEKENKVIKFPKDNKCTKSPTSAQRARALLELAFLIEHRDNWNQSDGFYSGWHNSHAIKWKIEIDRDEIKRSYSYYIANCFLYFGNEITRDHFYYKFKDKIEIIRLLF